MSVLLKKIVWYRYSNNTIPIPITDGIDMNLGRGIDIKNNIANLTLKNSAQSFDSSGNIQYNYIDNGGEILFEEQDQIMVYLKYTDDMSEVESNAWNPNSVILPSSIYLKGVYYVIEFSVEDKENGNPIKLKCADKCYIIFNRLFAYSFLKADNWDVPHTIQKVVRFSSQNQKGVYVGTGGDSGVYYDVDAKLGNNGVGSENGYIQETRKSTTEKGGVNADTTFPDITMAKVWKPVYEWINELSQIEYLNTADELTSVSDIVYGRPFLYYVDELNRFHWFETDNTVDETITMGTTLGIHNYKLDKKVFDTINFVIFRGGEDFYGKGTLGYFIDDTTNVKTRKMRVIAMTDIAKKLIQAEITNGNLVANTTGTFNFSGTKYNRNGTVIPSWITTITCDSDTNYNNSLKAEIDRIGILRSRSLVKGLTHARYKGIIDRKGCIVTVGSLLNITNNKTGQKSELLRVMDLKDTINKDGWFTSMEVEQDQEAIIEGDVI